MRQYGPVVLTGEKYLPAVSGADLIPKIRTEIRVEFAFECHRWFDIR
jgi:starch-binding outer membrane protein, SusD/RagB family